MAIRRRVAAAEEPEYAVTRILVDADACPVKDIIIRLAKRYGVPVTMVTDTSHTLCEELCAVVTVAKGADSVDFTIARMASRGDIVVTQDYGLAAMVLARGAEAIHQDGFLYTEENIDALLASRHVSQKIRTAGGRTKGPKKRAREDDERFKAALGAMLEARKPAREN